MELKALVLIFIGAAFVNNFVLSRFLGICPYIGVSKQTKPAVGMGLAVIFVMTCASAVTWLVYRFILYPFNLEFLRTVAFILVIASFVQLVEIFIQKFSPALYRTLGIYLPLITTNCAVLGVAVLNSTMFFPEGDFVSGSFAKSLIQGIGAGAGFTIAMVLMSGIRERLDLADVPESFRGAAIAFITAGLMSMAFFGFSGMTPQ
jgi:Na+-translocating ferredoxin:NAD+ oxidoreductase subunit A